MTKAITSQQAADLLITSKRTVHKLIASGKLPGKKIGNKYRTTEQACIAYLSSTDDTTDRNAGDVKGEVKPCQSPKETEYGTVISLRHQERELGALLARGTKSKLRSCTTN